MISIILCREITNENIDLLSKLIQHHKLYCKIFNNNLKYKHHVLLHYPCVMRLMGPIRNMSCIRFEAKRKELKATAKVVTSRNNFSLYFSPQATIAVKLSICFRKSGFYKRIDMGITLCDKYGCLQ